MYLQVINYLPLEQDFTGLRMVALTAHDQIGESALAGAVCAQQGVDLRGPDGHGEIIKDFFIACTEGESFNFDQWHLYSLFPSAA
jgi:hypothetical protein